MDPYLVGALGIVAVGLCLVFGTATRDRLARHPRAADVWLVVTAAIIGLCICGSIQTPCFELETEAGGLPHAGTSRAAYCGR